MRKYLTILFFCIALTGGACAVYSLYWDAEVRFWKNAIERKLSFARGLSEQNEPKLVFAGGSSCTFSINPDLLYDINSVNMGLHAGFGSKVNLAIGLEALERGDTFVLCVEPSQLTMPDALPPALGRVLSLASGNAGFSTCRRLTGARPRIRDLLVALRPGGRRVVTMLVKAILGRNIYRYSVDEMSDNGWCYTSYTDETARPVGPYTEDQHLSDDWRVLLESLRNYCSGRGIRVCYSMPWQFTEPSALDRNRDVNGGLLDEIEVFIPVIRDDYAGACTNAEWYADTGWHLTPEGSSARSVSFLKAFRSHPDFSF